MIYLAYFIFAFTILQLLIAFVNLVFKSQLPRHQILPDCLVSVLIPVRNEERNIGNLLNDLIHQDYQNIEIIVFNDMSTDKTLEIVKEYEKSDKRIRYFNSELLPEGWLGKNFACHSLAKMAEGEYMLFLDADVRLNKDIIINAISWADCHHLSLVSIFPKQVMKTTGEKITVPVMNYILLSLLPLILVRKSSRSSLAAANGQFMLFKKEVYNSLLPHKRMKNNKVEDIAIARLLKRNQHQIACMVGDNTIQCRMYEGFQESINGFSKNITEYFGGSWLISLIFWLITTFGFLIILITTPFIVLVIYLIAYFVTRLLISIISEQKLIDNFLYLIPQQISCGFMIYKALLNKYIKTYSWKGRNIQ